MGQNNDGLAGVDIENIAIEKTIIVGMQAPNKFPVMQCDENGRALPKMIVTENGGTFVKQSHGFNCNYVDTSWLAHCGKYSVAAGSKVIFSSGNGGFEVVTSGVFKTLCKYVDFISTNAITLTTKLFTVTTTQRMELVGGRFDMIFDDIYFQGNVNFVNNVHINGGLYVNGELICRHMTSQSQMNLTSLSDKTEAYLNPTQSFHFFNGASKAAEDLCKNIQWEKETKLPDSPAYIDCFIALMLPEPFDQLLNVPCKIAFPKGVSLLSDAVYKLQPKSSTIALQPNIRKVGSASEKPDIKGPSHQHSFKTPACRYLDSTADVFKKAKELTESEEPVKALPVVQDGLESVEMFKQQCKDLAEKEAEVWLSEMWDWIDPSSSPTEK